MRKSQGGSVDAGRAKVTRIFDKYSIIADIGIRVCRHCGAADDCGCDLTDSACLLEPRPENKIFWPLLAGDFRSFWSCGTTLVSRSRLISFVCSPTWHLPAPAYCGLSSRNSRSSGLRSKRWSSPRLCCLPCWHASDGPDAWPVSMLRNSRFAQPRSSSSSRPPIDFKFATWGYPGYFSGKNYLGQFAAVALLLSLYEAFNRRSAAGVWRHRRRDRRLRF